MSKQLASLGDLMGLEDSMQKHQVFPRGGHGNHHKPTLKVKGRAPQDVKHRQHNNHNHSAPAQVSQVTLRSMDVTMEDAKGNKKTALQVAQFGCTHKKDGGVVLLAACMPDQDPQVFRLAGHRDDEEYGVLEVIWTRGGLYAQVLTIPEVVTGEGGGRLASYLPPIRNANQQVMDALRDFVERDVRFNEKPPRCILGQSHHWDVKRHFLYRAVPIGVWNAMTPAINGVLPSLVKVDFGLTRRVGGILEHEASRSGCEIVIDPKVGVVSVTVQADVSEVNGYTPKVKVIGQLLKTYAHKTAAQWGAEVEAPTPQVAQRELAAA